MTKSSPEFFGEALNLMGEAITNLPPATCNSDVTFVKDIINALDNLLHRTDLTDEEIKEADLYIEIARTVINLGAKALKLED